MSLSDSAAARVYDALQERGWLIAPTRQDALNAIQRGLDQFIEDITGADA